MSLGSIEIYLHGVIHVYCIDGFDINGVHTCSIYSGPVKGLRSHFEDERFDMTVAALYAVGVDEYNVLVK